VVLNFSLLFFVVFAWSDRIGAVEKKEGVREKGHRRLMAAR
jgi:hypothetical protein